MRISTSVPSAIERALLDRGADLTRIPRTPKANLPMFTEQTVPLIDDELARTLDE